MSEDRTPNGHIGGEPFRVDVTITHPKWSLMGTGPTAEAALHDLFREARSVYRALRGEPAEKMSDECRRMRDFCRQWVPEDERGDA